ncbi:MAG: ATP-binding protein, partial [Dehalococcoidia bacterium]|nr:ATP-binding protein [Dehalococcoidia bacterium]
MYPQEVAEVVIVELIANSLDAGANRISIDYNPTQKTLIVSDNGRGMDAAQFDQYHDFAAGLKTRGTGIGFAGVGAKVSFNIADRVITETIGHRFSGGSDWYMQSNTKLVWDEILPTHLSDGATRVEVRFRHDITSSYTTRQDLVTLLQRNYLPLLDADFLELYERLGIYSNTFRFII